jgi:hypothetical protein
VSGQTLYPTAIVTAVNLHGEYTDIDDDPAAPDGLWLGVNTGTGPVISWTSPDPATDISRYRIAWYTDGYFVNSLIVYHVGGTTAYSEQIGDLPPATYEFFVTSIKTDNQESDPVSVGTKVIA